MHQYVLVHFLSVRHNQKAAILTLPLNHHFTTTQDEQCHRRFTTIKRWKVLCNTAIRKRICQLIMHTLIVFRKSSSEPCDLDVVSYKLQQLFLPHNESVVILFRLYCHIFILAYQIVKNVTSCFCRNWNVIIYYRLQLHKHLV